MQFLSLEFLAALSVVFLAYWAIPAKTWQNILLLSASLGLVFYLSRMALAVLIVSTIFEWLLARKMGGRTPVQGRSALLWSSISINLAQLAFFKYSGFFLPQAIALVSRFGLNTASLHILMPVGLSFWTLQKMTLTLDVYFRRAEAEKNLLMCLLFTSFFPTLLSGPIERSRDLLPQFRRGRVWDPQRFSEGVWLFAVGAFLKAVIADNVALSADALLAPRNSGWPLLLGIWAYALQIYGDFAGYSYMARGIAKLFGLEITQNFLAPYLARNLSDFWKHWHISLSGWLNEYIFVPASMKFRRWKTGGIIFAVWLTFIASGLWHGTGLTFFIYGCVHAIGLTFFILSKNLRKRAKERFGGAYLDGLATFITFQYVCLGYVFFRAPDLTTALAQIKSIFHSVGNPAGSGFDWKILLVSAVTVYWLQSQIREKKDVFWVFKRPIWYRMAIYLVLGFFLLRFYAPSDGFIYFQF